MWIMPEQQSSSDLIRLRVNKLQHRPYTPYAHNRSSAAMTNQGSVEGLNGVHDIRLMCRRQSSAYQ